MLFRRSLDLSLLEFDETGAQLWQYVCLTFPEGFTQLGALLLAEGEGVRSTLHTRAWDHKKSFKVIKKQCSRK